MADLYVTTAGSPSVYIASGGGLATSALAARDQVLAALETLGSVTRIYGPDEEVPDPPPVGALRIVFQPTPPSDPTGLQIAEGEDFLLASWDDLPVGTFTSYETRAVNLATGIAGPWVDTSTTAEHTFEDLLGGVEYRVDVRAVNGTALSGTTSATGTPTGPIDSDPPDTPTNLDATYLDDVVTLTWDDPLDADLAAIGIYQDGVLIDEVDPGVGTWDLAGFTDPTAPSWTVDAMDTSGNRSPESDPVGAPQGNGPPVFIAATTDTAATTETSLTAAKPAGVIVGRLLVAMVTLNDAAGVLTAPAGWTQLGSIIIGGSSRQAVYYRFVTSNSEGPYVWSWQNAAGGSLIIQAFRRVDGTTPIPVDSGGAHSAAATSIVMPSITTLQNNSLLVDLLSVLLAATVTPPGTVTDVSTAATGAGGDRASTMASQDRPTAGATGTRTYTLSTSRGTIRRTIALRSSSP